jgi:thiol-disulfide isomerase/thioredoxin
MTSDDRFFDSFRVLLAGPVEPDDAFGEQLFETLATGLGFRRGTRRMAIARRFPAAPLLVRLAYVAAILGLLLAAAVAAILAGAQLVRSKTAEEIVAASQLVQANPPAYDMTIRADDGRVVRVLVDGRGGWRLDSVSDPDVPAGTYVVHSSGKMGAYDPGSNTWTVATDDRSIVDASRLSWELTPQPSTTAQPPDWFTCSNWVRLADETVAGRPAYHVACGAREFWIDQESSILVGIRTPTGQPLAGVSGRATALVLSPWFPPNTFALTPPAGAVEVDQNNPPSSTVLAIGHPAPKLTSTTLDGKAFDTAAQARPLVVYFWATWCDPCSGPYLSELQTAAERHAAAVTTTLVATSDQLDSVTAFVVAHGIRLPVVNDSGGVNDNGSFAHSWGINATPTLVMLDSSGAVAAIRLGPIPTSELEQMYAALSAGEPVPTAEATPAASTSQ